MKRELKKRKNKKKPEGKNWSKRHKFSYKSKKTNSDKVKDSNKL